MFIKKILIVVIIVVMLANVIFPNYVFAASAAEKLVSSLLYLLSFVGDGIMSILQHIMVGPGTLKHNGQWRIRYSPGMIFANEVARIKN